METTTPSGQPIVSREKTAPFLIRTFLKIGSFHRLSLFEDNTLPTKDEQQIYTWKDATLREVLTTLRCTAPSTPEYRHPLARYEFRAVYADSAKRGRFAHKDLGIVSSRDILGEPGTLTTTAPRLLQDDEGEATEREKEERTLDELRFVPGDYLCIAVLLPRSMTVAVGPAGELALKTHVPATQQQQQQQHQHQHQHGSANGWRGAAAGGGRGDGGWSGSLAPASLGAGRGGGHWRGDSNAPPPGGGLRGGGGGRGGRGEMLGRDRDRKRELDARRGGDHRPPLLRRDPSPDRGHPAAGRGGRHRRSRSRSRSGSPSGRRRIN